MKARFSGVIKREQEVFPVKLFPLIQAKKVPSSYYHRNCGGKIGYQWVCEKHGVVDFEEVEKGYRVNDQIVYLEKEDFTTDSFSFPKGEIWVLFEQRFNFPPIFKEIFLVFPSLKEKDFRGRILYLGYVDYLSNKHRVGIVALMLKMGQKTQKVFGCLFPQVLFNQTVLLLGVLPFYQELEEALEKIKEFNPSPEEISFSVEAEKEIRKEARFLFKKEKGWPLFTNEEAEKMIQVLEEKVKEEGLGKNKEKRSVLLEDQKLKKENQEKIRITTQEKVWFTRREVMNYLGIRDKSTIYRYEKMGYLKPFYLPGKKSHKRYHIDNLKALLRSTREEK